LALAFGDAHRRFGGKEFFSQTQELREKVDL